MIKQLLGITAFVMLVSYLVYTFGSLTDSSPVKLFDTTIIEKYPNDSGTVQAVIEYDEPKRNSGLSTVPFYKVILETMSTKGDSISRSLVWSSQHKYPPTVRWIDNENIEILQMNEKIWEYTPTVSFDKKLYFIKLNFLPFEKH